MIAVLSCLLVLNFIPILHNTGNCGYLAIIAVISIKKPRYCVQNHSRRSCFKTLLSYLVSMSSLQNITNEFLTNQLRNKYKSRGRKVVLREKLLKEKEMSLFTYLFDRWIENSDHSFKNLSRKTTKVSWFASLYFILLSLPLKCVVIIAKLSLP